MQQIAESDQTRVDSETSPLQGQTGPITNVTALITPNMQAYSDVEKTELKHMVKNVVP